MDLKTAIAATPWLRRAWKYTPGPLRVPILVIGAVYLAWYVATGRHREGDGETA